MFIPGKICKVCQLDNRNFPKSGGRQCTTCLWNKTQKNPEAKIKRNLQLKQKRDGDKSLGKINKAAVLKIRKPLTEEQKIEQLRKAKLRRKNKPEKAILSDLKFSDKKKNLGSNDLDVEFVLATTKNGCFYCGDSKTRISLDRIDNSKPHNKDNVNPCCLRCNLMRRDMPYEAWMKLAPHIKQIYEEGLFGDWLSQPLTKLKNNIPRK